MCFPQFQGILITSELKVCYNCDFGSIFPFWMVWAPRFGSIHSKLHVFPLMTQKRRFMSSWVPQEFGVHLINGDAPTRITNCYSFLVWDVWACQLPLFNYFEKKSLQLHSITLLMHATLVPEQPQVPLHSSVVGIGPIGHRTSICMNMYVNVFWCILNFDVFWCILPLPGRCFQFFYPMESINRLQPDLGQRPWGVRVGWGEAPKKALVCRKFGWLGYTQRDANRSNWIG